MGFSCREKALSKGKAHADLGEEYVCMYASMRRIIFFFTLEQSVYHLCYIKSQTRHTHKCMYTYAYAHTCRTDKSRV
jgi:hypothetical protein